MTPPKIVLFDLGNVLLPFDPERRVRVMNQALGIGLDAARRFMASDIHAKLDRGEADDAALAQAISTLAGRPVPEAEARALVLSVFEAPNDVLWAEVARLRGRVRVGGFSDNPTFVRELFPPGAVLDPMFWSAELHATKSDPASYAAVLARLGVEPSAILFIDDSAANVTMARSLGWDALVFTGNEALAPQLAARGL